MAPPKKYNKKETREKKSLILQVLEEQLGVVSAACEITGIPRRTYYNWLKDDNDFAAQVKELNDVALDFAESKLFKKIKDGNIAAIIFYLKCKGKERGYVERQEIMAVSDAVEQMEDTQLLQFIVENISPQDLKQYINEN